MLLLNTTSVSPRDVGFVEPPYYLDVKYDLDLPRPGRSRRSSVALEPGITVTACWLTGGVVLPSLSTYPDCETETL